MERLKDDTVRHPLTLQFEAFVMRVGLDDVAALEAQAAALDDRIACADPGERDPCLALLRVRLAAAVANLLPMARMGSVAYAKRALQGARSLRGSRDIPTGSAEGLMAEAYLSLCKQASSTAKRALYFHQGRAAALRALEENPDEVSANLALGSFLLHAPRAFGGSPEKASPHLQRVLAVAPEHRGASMLLAEAFFRTGRRDEFQTLLDGLRDASPRFAAFLLDVLLSDAGPDQGGDR